MFTVIVIAVIASLVVPYLIIRWVRQTREMSRRGLQAVERMNELHRRMQEMTRNAATIQPQQRTRGDIVDDFLSLIDEGNIRSHEWARILDRMADIMQSKYPNELNAIKKAHVDSKKENKEPINKIQERLQAIE